MARYSETVKAEALQRLLSGESIHSIARALGVSRQAIQEWRDKAGLLTNPVRPQKKEELGELIGQLLFENIRGLRAIADLASDRAWTEKQNAADLAIFYGVLADKSVRILGALTPSAAPQS